MRGIRLLSMAALGAALCGSLLAGPITGTFSMSGDVTVTATTIDWTSDAMGNAANMFTLTLGSPPSYSTEDGQNGIANLNIAVEPVNSAFTPVTFITFDVTPSLPPLELNFIEPGQSNSSECGATPAVNQTCTPPNAGGSPFTFTNNEPGSNIQSTAQWVFTGVTSDGATWQVDFTSQFGVPFQTVLQNLQTNGFVENSYSATVTVQGAAPEPSSLVMFGIGLGLVVLWRSGAAARKRNRIG